MGFMMENEHDQVHCCAVGLEPYDQTYSLDYKVGHED